MKLFMIIADKVPNTLTGTMSGTPLMIGESYYVPGKGHLKLESIREGIGFNKKPVVVCLYTGSIAIEYPDYNIDKFRDYSDEGQHTQATNKGQKHK